MPLDTIAIRSFPKETHTPYIYYGVSSETRMRGILELLEIEDSIWLGSSEFDDRETPSFSICGVPKTYASQVALLIVSNEHPITWLANFMHMDRGALIRNNEDKILMRTLLDD